MSTPSVNQVLTFVEDRVPVLNVRQRYTDLTTWYEGQTPAIKTVIKICGFVAALYFVFRSILFGAIVGAYQGVRMERLKVESLQQLSLPELLGDPTTLSTLKAFAMELGRLGISSLINSACLPAALGTYIGIRLAEPAVPRAVPQGG